jgi:hypothetical protein
LSDRAEAEHGDPGLAASTREEHCRDDEVVEIAEQGPLGWRFVGYSSFNSG